MIQNYRFVYGLLALWHLACLPHHHTSQINPQICGEFVQKTNWSLFEILIDARAEFCVELLIQLSSIIVYGMQVLIIMIFSLL